MKNANINKLRNVNSTLSILAVLCCLSIVARSAASTSYCPSAGSSTELSYQLNAGG